MAIKIFGYLNIFRGKIISFKALAQIKNYSTSISISPELEKAFNCQINLEFYASFTYLAMACHFGNQNISLPGCHKYFLDQVQDEREHAHKFIDYLLRRGNVVSLQPLEAPVKQSWSSPLEAFQEALRLENIVSHKIFELLKSAENEGDKQACIFIENEFLENQIEESDRLSRHAAELEKIGSNGLGIYLFDKYLLKETNK